MQATTRTDLRYSYLARQFEHPEEIIENILEVVRAGDFTLGKAVEKFEREFAALIGTKHAIGVNSGTDAIKLSLKALGVGYGDEVITAANTFVATVGAIAETGATPVLVDCDDSFCIDTRLIEAAITSKTKAIVPVHFTGNMPYMATIKYLADKYKLVVVEDAAQAILATRNGRNAGSWGDAGAFSLHPLKSINVWGDGGVITTDDNVLAHTLRLLRNHGLADRDTVQVLGCNSRLDSVHACVASYLLKDVAHSTFSRRFYASEYDSIFREIKGITIPTRDPGNNSAYHLYMVFAEDRDNLLVHLQNRGVPAKVHYPVPLYLQPALRHLGYKPGDFPVADRHAKSVITFPVDQFRSEDEVRWTAAVVREFYEQ